MNDTKHSNHDGEYRQFKTPDPTPEQKAFWETCQKTIAQTVRANQLAINGLTEAQFVEVIRQAIACGDFERHVRVGEPHAQAVIYIPYAREQELESRIHHLESVLKAHNITDPNQTLETSTPQTPCNS